jgi:selenocysteine-specific elongation factor
MIVGTAGHIDHGKTSLIARLTGKDTDRLPEEKRRGISIELGYAYLAVPNTDSVLGFVDVPGHEKFVHAMVSGATGIDYALLVIAADDGPMPQTREHLDILRLLGVHAGAIVVTKMDTIDPAFSESLLSDIKHAVAASPAEHWPRFMVSSKTGEGIDGLRDHLFQATQALTKRSVHGHFRLAVDRSFTLSGLGTVVTGTAHAGAVRIGDELVVFPSGKKARVRSIHAQDRTTQEGIAGQRLAINLVGLSIDDVPRGSWVNGHSLENQTLRFDAWLSLSEQHDRVISQGLEVHLHHGTDNMLAKLYPLESDKLKPGESSLVSVVCSRRLSACRGDHFLVRDSQAQTTLGGGLVLDIFPPVRGRRTGARLAALHAFSLPDSERLRALLKTGPLPLKRLCNAWNLSAEDAQDLAQGLPCPGGVLMDPPVWSGFREAVVMTVDQTHMREPEMPGVEINRLRRAACPQLEPEGFYELLEGLVNEGLLQRQGVFVHRPSHKAELSAAERNLWRSIAPLLQENPFNPPRVRDIAKQTNLPEAEIRANLKRVARVGEVTLVALDHFFVTEHVAVMADKAAEIADSDGVVRAAAFRDAIGSGRKVAIQILEFFDRVGYTRRLRDDHLIRRPNPWRQGS